MLKIACLVVLITCLAAKDCRDTFKSPEPEMLKCGFCKLIDRELETPQQRADKMKEMDADCVIGCKSFKKIDVGHCKTFRNTTGEWPKEKVFGEDFCSCKKRPASKAHRH
ncbi:hypothetical protein HDE_04920 [Halotydeus destructor]|nr:hypothetical protein HDE_04920 [Halotydeus destructor]